MLEVSKVLDFLYFDESKAGLIHYTDSINIFISNKATVESLFNN